MNQVLRRLVFLAAALIPAFAHPATAQSADEAEIRAVATRQGEAWSRHDAKAYAALFTKDCDVVNVVGWWWKGRNELEHKLTPMFSSMFSTSQLAIKDVHVRFLSPDIALVHARWTMTGARMPPGIPEPRAGIQTLVFTKVTGRWLITGFQNTNSVPEQPIPAGPAAPVRREP